MQYNVENSDYAVEFTAVNMDVAVTGQAEIEVAVGDAARIDVGEALNYIKTGTAEIEAVAQEKTDAFNLNAINKTNAFNDNYTAKKALIDAEVANAAASATAAGNSATDAEASATAADNSAKDAKQWAIGDPSEPTGNSAKYWANEAEATVANKQDLLTSANAGTGISITGSGANVLISNTQTSAEWGNINGTLSDQTDLQNALNNLSGGIDSNHQAISSINQTISTYGNIVTHNTSEFATASQGALADTALQPNDNISELYNNVGYITGITSLDVTTALGYTPYNSSNPSNYQTATQVANSIATETTNRENADNNLQSQIDAIVSSSDVYDIVGTYAELQAYDITTVPVNDFIKVLVDSTHSGAATYYRCVETGGVKSWSYIGSEGAYYTKAEADAAFVPQTRTVNNKALSANVTLTPSDLGITEYTAAEVETLWSSL
jgi:hypothetical protein